MPKTPASASLTSDLRTLCDSQYESCIVQASMQAHGKTSIDNRHLVRFILGLHLVLRLDLPMSVFGFEQKVFLLQGKKSWANSWQSQFADAVEAVVSNFSRMAVEASRTTTHAVDVPKLLQSPTLELLPLLTLLEGWKSVSTQPRFLLFPEATLTYKFCPIYSHKC